MSINIEPYTISYTASYFKVAIDDFVIGTSITFRLAFYDSDNNFINNKLVTVGGIDYQDLIHSGDSDTYIFNYLQTNLGFTISV